MHRSSQPVKFGTTGLGGYAWVVAEKIAARPDVAKLLGVCDPHLHHHAERAEAIRRLNARTYESFDELLKEPIDAVWLPLPINLHRQFVTEALAAGKAVLCEKPAAATTQEVDAMIRARDQAGLPVIVGYQHLADPAILQIKRRILAGELGEIRSARVVGCWPRPAAYYSRNNWAGRLGVDSKWVLDSPLSNAMSHYLQLAMYLLGSEENRTAEAAEIQAELYRVNPIENFDTCSVRIWTEQGAQLLVLLTHASFENVEPTVEILGTQGSASIHPEQRIEWRSAKRSETIPLSADARDRLLEGFCRLIRHEPLDCALATLEIARAPIVVVNSVAETAAPIDIKPVVRRTGGLADSDPINTIPDIAPLFHQCGAAGKMIHESGLASWSGPAQSKSVRGYRHFTMPALSVAGSTRVRVV
jgi:predicted dehydrogenase